MEFINILTKLTQNSINKLDNINTNVKIKIIKLITTM